MKVKIFTPDSNGNISFSKRELEKLLNEVYEDGVNDGKNKVWSWSPYYTTTAAPYTTTLNTTSDPIKTNTITCSNNIDNNLKLNYGETKNINSNSSL